MGLVRDIYKNQYTGSIYTKKIDIGIHSPVSHALSMRICVSKSMVQTTK